MLPILKGRYRRWPYMWVLISSLILWVWKKNIHRFCFPCLKIQQSGTLWIEGSFWWCISWTKGSSIHNNENESQAGRRILDSTCYYTRHTTFFDQNNLSIMVQNISFCQNDRTYVLSFYLTKSNSKSIAILT